MDAESRWFYAVGLSAVLLGAFGLALATTGAAVPSDAAVWLLLLVVVGAASIALARRGIAARWREWRASRPKSWPAGWKMEPKRPA